MINRKHKRYKPVYKKFLRLRVNVQNNEKITSFKRKKWQNFLAYLHNSNSFYRLFKPYTYNHHRVSKFASSGNSFGKKFRNDLIAKKIVNHFYGGLLLKKYLKKRIKEMYKSKKFKNSKLLCLEFFESRLDSVLYRSKFGFSMRNARQLIAHKHVKVNNKVEKNNSYILKQGDFIKIDSKAVEIVKTNLDRQPTKIINFQKNVLWPIPPSYLTINYNTMEIIFGDITNYNFSSLFPFNLDLDSVITSYYRH